ncbi:unnamed protein product, partial [Aphanomyces euteiches]
PAATMPPLPPAGTFPEIPDFYTPAPSTTTPSPTTTPRPTTPPTTSTNSSTSNNINSNSNPTTPAPTSKSDNTLVIVQRRRHNALPVAVHYVEPLEYSPAPGVPARKSSVKTIKSSSTGGSTAAWNPSNKQLDLGTLKMFRIPPTDISIVKPIAAGAYGQVGMAYYHDQVVAVKSLLAAKRTNMDQLVHFVNEIKLHSQIECDYIVQFIGASWNKPSDIVMVTEYMDKGDLRNFLQATTPATLAWRDKLDVALSVGHALVYLHSLDLKVIHRDLKSRNVLLNSAMHAKLTDFGVSREFDDIETLTADVGTYRWMAPEVLQDGHYTESADIYSFGVILAELSTHLIPYQDLKNARGNPYTDTALMAKVMQGEIMPSFAVGSPLWYVQFGQRCMALKPQRRPTAMEVVHMIMTELRKLH